MSNIYDIAAKTGFSPSTVARALSGKGYVSKETKSKILAAAENMHYIPSHTARSLRSKKTHKILMCIPDLYNPFYFGLIKGASDILESRNYHIVLCHSKRILKEELKIINMLNEHYGDGMLFITFGFNEANMAALADTKMPIVTTNRVPFDNFIDCVTVDLEEAMYLATCHLIEMGHKEIGILIRNVKNPNNSERFVGFAKAMNEHGLPIRQDRIIVSDVTREYTRVVMNRHFKKHKGPIMTAIAVSTTLIGIGCIDACEDYGVKIPDDLSIVSLDDIDTATCTKPKLTVIDIRQEELGKKAAELLLEQIEGRTKKKTIFIEPKLIARDSVLRIRDSCHNHQIMIK